MDSGSLHFLALSSNEGAQRAGQATLQVAIEASCKSTGFTWDDLDAIVVARQDGHVGAGAGDWAAAAEALGFGHQIVDVRKEGAIRQSLAVFAKEAEAFQVADSFHTRPVHDDGKLARFGVATVVLSHRRSSLRVCLGSGHMDGGVSEVAERMSNVSAAVYRAVLRAGPLDAAFVMGDMNCTLEPRMSTPQAAAALGAGDETRRLLVEEMEHVVGSSDKDALAILPEAARTAFQRSLAIQEGRAALQVLDSNPQILDVNEDVLQYDQNASGDSSRRSDAPGAVFRLELHPMPPGSFPTYRFCGNTCVADGVKSMIPEMTVEPAQINDWYFMSEDGKAGAIKKRKEMVRIQLGWLDRIYSGLGPEREDLGPVTKRIVQGESMAIPVMNSTLVFDHLMVPWLISLQADGNDRDSFAAGCNRA